MMKKLNLGKGAEGVWLGTVPKGPYKGELYAICLACKEAHRKRKAAGIS